MIVSFFYKEAPPFHFSKMQFIFFMKYVAFPESSNALFKNNKVNVEASGSLGYYDGRKCHQTYPNQTLIGDPKIEWCSNLAKDKSDKPWIQYSLENKKMSINGYSLRSGCCYYACCCADDNTIFDDVCCCRLYSFSLQASNDNRTWKVLHKVEKKNDFGYCKIEKYEFSETEPFTYFRLVQDEEFPYCPFCMQINQVELYGRTVDSYYSQTLSDAEDESVSIIGKVRNQ